VLLHAPGAGVRGSLETTEASWNVTTRSPRAPPGVIIAHMLHRRRVLRRVSAVGCLSLVVGFGSSAAGGPPAVHEVAIDCRVTSSNDGCEARIACPPGSAIQSVTAACNLEYGPITDEHLGLVEPGYLQVLRPSDHVAEGQCWLGAHRTASGRIATADLAGQTGVWIGCQEYDRNGGDCHIRGALYCQ
jgi:hypothetical protein